MGRPSFEDLTARGGIKHAPARRRQMPTELAATLGFLAGLLLVGIPAWLIYGGPS